MIIAGICFGAAVRHDRAARVDHQAGFSAGAPGGDRALQHTPKNSPLRATYEWIVERGGARAKNIAKVTVARKLLTLVYYGLRDDEIHCLDHGARADEVVMRANHAPVNL